MEWILSGKIPFSLVPNYLEDKGGQKHQDSHQMVVFPQKNSLNLTVLGDVIESQNRNTNYTHPINTHRQPFGWLRENKRNHPAMTCFKREYIVL